MNYVYLLRCADNTLYTGWTDDLAKRVKAHNSGRGAKYTRSRGPVTPVYFELFESKEEAQSREYRIKHLTRAEKEALVREGGGFRCHKENGRTVVTVPRGVHYITSPLTVRASHLEIRGEEGAILRGCLPLGNCTWHPLEGGAYYTELPRPVDGLYVGGKSYMMARYPKYNPLIPIFGGYSADATSAERASRWADPRGGYIHAMHSHHWGGFSYKITGKDENGHLIYEGGWQNNRQMGMHRDFRYVENIYEEMTEPGEWCYDEGKGRLCVIPREGDDLATAEAVVNSAFLTFEKCEDVVIRNLRFERSARTFMLTREPLLRSDWTIYRGGAVTFRGCRHCSVDTCAFEDVGSNGVFVDGKNESVITQRTHFRRLGASAVCFVGRSDAVRSPLFVCGQTQSIHDMDLKKGPKNRNYPVDCGVDDCLISHVGLTEKQATGVEISMSRRIFVRNTTIHHTSRAGINVSEGTFGGHRIEGCDVFDTVKETGDHGSFNSWGRDRYWHAEDLADEDAHRYAFLDCVEPTVICYSRFRCDRGWDIDLDDGSSRYELHHNLCLNGGIKLREGFGRHVHHNVTVNNSVHFHVWYPNSGDVVENNIVFTPYKPIMMKGKWGKRVDGNILHNGDVKVPVPAASLAALSGEDGASREVDCAFADPMKGDYRVNSPYVSDFADFPTEFGVRYAPLRAIAETPVLPMVGGKEEDVISEARALFGMKVKNVETDGEMSAYATAGHNGVIVLDVEHFGPAGDKGLLPGDVIVAAGEKEINAVADLEALGEKRFFASAVTVQRAPGRTVLG